MSGEKGFTLAELAVVIAVASIAILGVIMSVQALRRDSLVSQIVAYTKDFKQALQRFQSIYGRLPNDLNDNEFVPKFLSNPYATQGFKLVAYTKNNISCNNEPTIKLSISDPALPKALAGQVRLCDRDSNATNITIYVTP